MDDFEEYDVGSPEYLAKFQRKTMPNIDDNEPVQVQYYGDDESKTMLAKSVDWERVKTWWQIDL